MADARIGSGLRGWKATVAATVAGAVTATLFALLAFLFLASRQHPFMGEALFLLVPISAGFCIAIIARKPDSIVAVAILSVISTLLLLIGLGKEGPLCAILALPIILAGLAIGVGAGVLVRKLIARFANNAGTTGMLLLAAPLLIFAGERVETPLFRQPRVEVVENAILVNDSPERVWQDILAIDNVRATKPLLMYVGLPIPERCTLQGRGVGAKRTCYFNAGSIEETVTEWNPPYSLGLSIDRTHMPGRHWLAFESAEYRLEAHGVATLLTRRTTISSHLQPAWYWRGFERMGVEAEHNYILQDVALRVSHER
jgi:hypothetical protein